jgi:hypothetical protein
MTLIKNINGTSDNKCICGSWLKHWEKFSKKTANYCAEKTCIENTDLVGAHVQKANSQDDNWYIVPLCKKHNASVGELEVVLELVSANKKETCDKTINQF